VTPSPAAPVDLPDLFIAGMGVQLETGNSCGYTSTVLGLRVEIANAGNGLASPFVVEVNSTERVSAQGKRSRSGFPASQPWVRQLRPLTQPGWWRRATRPTTPSRGSCPSQPTADMHANPGAVPHAHTEPDAAFGDADALTQSHASPTPVPPSPTVTPDNSTAPTTTPTLAPPSPSPAPVPVASSPTAATVPSPTSKAAPAAQPDVRIACIFFDGVVLPREPNEYVEIVNLGGAPQDLKG
jgi:hypothetical protein